ncbi:MAG: acyl-CoA thioesterase [Eubacterium sp.]|nr:acyl-CoA thioesterase [Eubacterium sp.]
MSQDHKVEQSLEKKQTSREEEIRLNDYPESYVRVVNYYETDQMHVVHHSNYARYLEEARLHMMDQIGLAYDKLERMGIIIPVLELHDYYIKSIGYGDIIEIVPRIIKLSSVRFTLKYNIYRSGTDELLHKAETSHAFLDSEFKPISLKRKFPEIYDTFLKLVVKDDGQ